MSNVEFASASLTAGQLNAIVKKLGGPGRALRFLRDELSVSEPARLWREEDGIIYFSVTSDGKTGPEWISLLEGKGLCISEYARQLLMSDDFKPTTRITSRIAILKGMLFEDNCRSTKKICAEAEKRKFSKPKAEIACLIRENFTDKEIKAMGLWYFAVMHEPVNDSGSGLGLLSARRDGGGIGLSVYNSRPDDRWGRAGGFAFVVSQVGHQN